MASPLETIRRFVDGTLAPTAFRDALNFHDAFEAFLGQVAIDNYFHDLAAAYVFHDPVSGACQTIIQVY